LLLQENVALEFSVFTGKAMHWLYSALTLENDALLCNSVADNYLSADIALSLRSFSLIEMA